MILIFLANNQSSAIIESTLDFSYSHIIDLMQSTNLTVQLKASNALSTYVYNNTRIHLYVSEHYQLAFNYFEKFLQNNNDYTRCTAAFQVC